jgi:hypothetical protein
MDSERKASVDDKRSTPFIEASASNFSDAGDKRQRPNPSSETSSSNFSDASNNQKNAYRFQSL